MVYKIVPKVLTIGIKSDILKVPKVMMIKSGTKEG